MLVRVNCNIILIHIFLSVDLLAFLGVSLLGLMESTRKTFGKHAKLNLNLLILKQHSGEMTTQGHGTDTMSNIVPVNCVSH